jgi:hypothetical protein
VQHAHLTAPQLNDRIQQAIDRGDRKAALELRSPFLAAVKAEDESRARSARAVNKQLGVDVGNPVSIHYHPRDVKGHPKLTTVGGWYEVRRYVRTTSHYGFTQLEYIGAIYLDGDGSAFIATRKGEKRDVRCLTLTDAARYIAGD